MEILLPTVRKRDSQMIWTWNPEQPEDPVDAYFHGPRPPDNAIVTHVDFRDNPFFADTAMPAEMEKLRNDNFSRYRHIWLGEYDEY
jgi:phage terminase large subunit